MFYIMYLTSLCTRRNWPTPQFVPFRHRRGHGCVVRVNNREYSTGDTAYESEELAKNAAATQAYMICRNFSVNDGMMPGQRPGMAAASDAVCQGLPVAIGTGRRRRTTADSSASSEHFTADGEYSSSSGSSGGGSPRRLSQGDLALAAAARRYAGDRRGSGGLCVCRRAQVMGYGRCVYCLREAGYTVTSYS
ncbi:hypothetical protein K461DRAFT_100379 [Myriangium duriaei CBS 260.36]|uniref:DRBM domain-containing protein n=1 Tax=Myriangium duriaei CBS 260.36 TaxID=1168546 RepID=A0A9P4MPH9_9PEZI|nr:hypothetical protein K461DRAFT_100379 [Myriangium duriaei CBS 260.36]